MIINKRSPADSAFEAPAKEAALAKADEQCYLREACPVRKPEVFVRGGVGESENNLKLTRSWIIDAHISIEVGEYGITFHA